MHHPPPWMNHFLSVIMKRLNILDKKNILQSAAVTFIEWEVGTDLAKLHFWQSWYIIIWSDFIQWSSKWNITHCSFCFLHLMQVGWRILLSYLSSAITKGKVIWSLSLTGTPRYRVALGQFFTKCLLYTLSQPFSTNSILLSSSFVLVYKNWRTMCIIPVTESSPHWTTIFYGSISRTNIQ